MGSSATQATYFTTLRPTTLSQDDYEDDYDYYDDIDEEDLDTSTKSYNMTTKSSPFVPRDHYEPPLEYFKSTDGKQLKNPYANNFDFDKFLTELREQVYGKSSTIGHLVTTSKSVQQTPKMLRVEGLSVPLKSATLKPASINNKNLQSYLKYKLTQQTQMSHSNQMNDSDSYEDDDDYYDEDDDYDDYEDGNLTGIVVPRPRPTPQKLPNRGRYEVKENDEDYDSEEYEDSEEYDDKEEEDITEGKSQTTTTTTKATSVKVEPTVRTKFKKVTRPATIRYPQLNLTKVTTEKILSGDCLNNRRSYRVRGKNRCAEISSIEDNHNKIATMKPTTVKQMIDLTLKQLRGGRILSKTLPVVVTTTIPPSDTTFSPATLDQTTGRTETTHPYRQSTKIDSTLAKTLKATISNQIPGSTTERLKNHRLIVTSATPDPNPSSPTLRQRHRQLKDSAKDFLSKAFTQRALTQMR